MTKEYDELFERITEGKTKGGFHVNKLYKNSSYGFYWYINRSGRLHVKTIEKIVSRAGDLSISFYQIEDHLIGYDCMMKHSSTRDGMYKTKEEAEKAMMG